MHRLGKLLVLVVAACVGFGVLAGPAAADPASHEAAFVAHINALRAGRGLGGLAVDARLTESSRAWSAQMAAAGGISHDPNLPAGAPVNWVKLGENVGVGGSVDSIHAAFVASPTHFANLVDPAFNYVGIGVVESGGSIFVTERFMAAAPAPAPAPAGMAAAAPAPAAAAPAAASAATKVVCTKAKRGRAKKCTTVKVRKAPAKARRVRPRR